MLQKTHVVKAADIKHDWLVVDAAGKRSGSIATFVAGLIRGKHKPTYTPSMDLGDHVIVINAAELDIPVDRLTEKKYYSHSGYLGGLRTVTLGREMEKHPTRVIERAVRGMLPRGPLGNRLFRKLHVYAGAEHPHAAQQPKEVKAP